MLNDRLPTIPPHKWLCIVYQLASRLAMVEKAADSSLFQRVLQRLIVDIASMHPFHTMYILFAMRNADMAEKAPKFQVC